MNENVRLNIVPPQGCEWLRGIVLDFDDTLVIRGLSWYEAVPPSVSVTAKTTGM